MNALGIVHIHNDKIVDRKVSTDEMLREGYFSVEILLNYIECVENGKIFYLKPFSDATKFFEEFGIPTIGYKTNKQLNLDYQACLFKSILVENRVETVELCGAEIGCCMYSIKDILETDEEVLIRPRMGGLDLNPADLAVRIPTKFVEHLSSYKC